MSNEILQTIAVAVIVLAAAAFLVWRRVRKKARPSSQCGDCPACGPTETQPDDWSKLESPQPKLVVRRGNPSRT